MLARLRLFLLLPLFFLAFARLFSQPCTGITIADADVSSQRILRIFYDNDFFAGTQRYYTHSLRAELIHPRFKDLWLSKRLLLRIGRRARTYYGLGIRQQAFSPEAIDARDIVPGDRPYAGSLELSHFLISNDSRNKLRLTTSLDLGLIGPLALGRMVTANSQGWDHQIATDLIIGYRARLEKGLFESQNVDMQAFGQANLSTLQPHAALGAQLRIGILNPYFFTLHFTQKSIQGSRVIKKTQFFLQLTGQGQAIAYDASLQGGLLNRNSPYRLEGSEINRLIGQFSASVNLIHGRLGLAYAQVFRSKSFKAGLAHSWGSVRLFLLL
jgi:lipid A 3-O-deacylase